MPLQNCFNIGKHYILCCTHFFCIVFSFILVFVKLNHASTENLTSHIFTVVWCIKIHTTIYLARKEHLYFPFFFFFIINYSVNILAHISLFICGQVSLRSITRNCIAGLEIICIFNFVGNTKLLSQFTRMDKNFCSLPSPPFSMS